VCGACFGCEPNVIVKEQLSVRLCTTTSSLRVLRVLLFHIWEFKTGRLDAGCFGFKGLVVGPGNQTGLVRFQSAGDSTWTGTMYSIT